MYNIVLEQEAQDEVEQTYQYYLEHIGSEVADMFYDDLQDAYDALELNPFYQRRKKSYRAFPLRRFPFLLFFEIDENLKLVRVLAVFNTHQDSKKWP